MSTEGSAEDNPFQEDGELRRKADYIISHSRISRTEVQIVDPDTPVQVEQPDPVLGEDTSQAVFQAVSESSVETTKAAESQGQHDTPSNGTRQPEVTSEQQTTMEVEVEVERAVTTSNEDQQQAKQVKLKSKKKCSVQ